MSRAVPTHSPVRSAERARPGALGELALIATVFVAYRQIRFLTRNDTAAAFANARRVVGFERRLGVFSEAAVQDLSMRSRAVVELLNRYYVSVHFPLTVVFLIWVFVRHGDAYRQIRRWFVAVTVAALAIHVAFPLAPPRMLTELGFVDTLDRFGPRIYSTDTERSIANQFAAMPSLHFGWAAMVAGGFVAIRSSRASLLALAHPLITLLAIVATANHYWLDAAVALVLVAGIAAVGCRSRQAVSARSTSSAVIQPARRSTNSSLEPARPCPSPASSSTSPWSPASRRTCSLVDAGRTSSSVPWISRNGRGASPAAPWQPSDWVARVHTPATARGKASPTLTATAPPKE